MPAGAALSAPQEERPAATGPQTPQSVGSAEAGWSVGLLVVVTLALRALAFPFTDNLWGDAVVRTQLAERWLAAPHLISSFNDGVLQFGPLHTYVVAAFLALWKNREDAGRLASMVFGVITVFPLHRMVRRVFDDRAATWSALAFAVWGLHIQASTTAASEALGLWLFAESLDGLMEGLLFGPVGPLVRSAVFLNLGCAVRYDLWMYIPIFFGAICLRSPDRIGSATRAILFGGLASVFPLWWMQGNERAMGDPLYPIHFIDQFHANWTKQGIAWLGEWKLREWGAVFWPGTVLVTLSPLYGLLCFVGIARAFLEKQRRTLAVLAAIPTAYYTLRAAVLLNFTPLARFAILQVFLCIPYAASGFEWLSRNWTLPLRRAALAVTAAVAVATPAIYGVLSYRAEGGWGWTLKPVSPVTTMPQIQMTVAHWLRDHVPAGEKLIVDWDDAYTDIGVDFFSNIPDDHILRSRWKDFLDRAAAQTARYAVVFKNGKLGERDPTGATIAGRHYHSIQSFQNGDFEVLELDRS